MELRHLRYFLAVAETLSFTRAAAQHYVAQSALSQQVAGLETELGVRLFHRTSRSVTLTEAGRALVPLAQRVVADAELLRMEMDALAGLRRGTLRLGLIQTHATSIDIIEVMGEYHARHPAIDLEITDEPSTRMADSVATGALDDAVVGLDPGELPTGVVGIPLAVEPLVAVLSTGNPLAGRRLVTVTELARDQRFIHFTRDSGLRRRVDAAFARAGARSNGAFEMGQILDMIRLAARGIGVTIVPHTHALDAERAAGTPFAVVPLADREAQHPVSLIHHRDRISPPAAAFIAQLRKLPDQADAPQHARSFTAE